MATPQGTMIKLQPCGRTSCAPTPAEAYSLDFDRLSPNNRLLLTRPRLVLEGPLDVDALHKTIEEIVARHTVLGSRFVEEGSGIVHHIATERLSVPMELVSFEQTPADQHEARWNELFADVARPFDVSKGPLLRTVLVKLGPDRHVLTFVIHHAVFDRPSMNPMIAELKAGYLALTAKTDWPAPKLQCIDLAAFIEAFAGSPMGLKQRAYWDKTLAGVQPLELPIDRPRTALDAERDAHPRGMAFRSVGEVTGKIPTPLHTEIGKFARAEKISNYVVLLSAMAAALYRARKQNDITFQSTYSMRNKPALANMIGYIGNPIVMRIDTSGNPTYKELLGRVRNMVFTSWSNADIPLIDRLPHGIRRLNFNYVPGVEGTGGTQEFAPGLTVTEMRAPMELELIQIPWDLHAWLYDATDRCMIRLVYAKELFEQATVQALLESWLAAVSEMCQDPSKRLE
jgi:hypothetical protein